MARNSRHATSLELVYQLVSLLISLLVVHAAYVAVIRPKAEFDLAEQAVGFQTQIGYVAKRSVYVIMRDYEQESCFVLLFWAVAILVYKGVLAAREHRILDLDLIAVGEGVRILPEDAREYARQIESLPATQHTYLLPRTLLAGLHRFGATRSIQDVSTTTQAICESESDRLDSELSMIRYIAWAIPSIGFIGTVRGIGDALAQAHKAVEGDITGVTESLGVAFNSTFVALLISIVLMFLLHQLQLKQERLVLDTKAYLDEHLIQHLRSGA